MGSGTGSKRSDDPTLSWKNPLEFFCWQFFKLVEVFGREPPWQFLLSEPMVQNHLKKYLSVSKCNKKSFSLHRMDPGSGNLVTFSQFAFIALEGFIFTAKFGREPLRIGFQSYLLLVVMFFLSSVLNNYAFDFNIPMPLHMIFRAVSFDSRYNLFQPMH